MCGHKDGLRADLVKGGTMDFWCIECMDQTACIVDAPQAPTATEAGDQASVRAVGAETDIGTSQVKFEGSK